MHRRLMRLTIAMLGSLGLLLSFAPSDANAQTRGHLGAEATISNVARDCGEITGDITVAGNYRTVAGLFVQLGHDQSQDFLDEPLRYNSQLGNSTGQVTFYEVDPSWMAQSAELDGTAFNPASDSRDVSIHFAVPASPASCSSPPTASFSGSISKVFIYGREQNAITVDASSSTGSSGESLTFEWFLSLETRTGESATTLYVSQDAAETFYVPFAKSAGAQENVALLVRVSDGSENESDDQFEVPRSAQPRIVVSSTCQSPVRHNAESVISISNSNEFSVRYAVKLDSQDYYLPRTQAHAGSVTVGPGGSGAITVRHLRADTYTVFVHGNDQTRSRSAATRIAVCRVFHPHVSIPSRADRNSSRMILTFDCSDCSVNGHVLINIAGRKVHHQKLYLGDDSQYVQIRIPRGVHALRVYKGLVAKQKYLLKAKRVRGY